MIDLGWRRSGHYLYKPNGKTSCCSLYTIRLDSYNFKIAKEQKKAIKKWVNYVNGKPLKPMKSKISTDYLNNAFQTIESLGAEKYSVTMEPCTYTDEKFEVFKKYQMQVHLEKEEEITKKGFSRFLCNSPLFNEDKGIKYGSYHQMYRFQGRLVAVGVLDLLPHGVSSVYLFYDPDMSKFSLGRISACREIWLALECGYRYYYMGYYIHTCPKMKYKATYSPSYLLNPGTNKWIPIENFTSLWNTGAPKYISFGDENNSDIQTAVDYDSSEDSSQNEDDYTLFNRQLPGILSVNVAESLVSENFANIGNSTFPTRVCLYF